MAFEDAKTSLGNAYFVVGNEACVWAKLLACA